MAGSTFTTSAVWHVTEEDGAQAALVIGGTFDSASLKVWDSNGGSFLATQVPNTETVRETVFPYWTTTYPT